jgi:hypothetical protein
VLEKRPRRVRDYTDYSLHGRFNKFKMHSSALLAGHTFRDRMCLLLTERDYVYSILQATAECNIENLKLYLQAVGDCIDTVLISTTDYGSRGQPGKRARGTMGTTVRFPYSVLPWYSPVKVSRNAATAAQSSCESSSPDWYLAMTRTASLRSNVEPS